MRGARRVLGEVARSGEAVWQSALLLELACEGPFFSSLLLSSLDLSETKVYEPQIRALRVCGTLLLAIEEGTPLQGFS